MEVLAKRAITPRVSGIPGTPFVSILLATYNSAQFHEKAMNGLKYTPKEVQQRESIQN
jgi:hypothetical protein